MSVIITSKRQHVSAIEPNTSLTGKMIYELGKRLQSILIHYPDCRIVINWVIDHQNNQLVVDNVDSIYNLITAFDLSTYNGFSISYDYYVARR